MKGPRQGSGLFSYGGPGLHMKGSISTMSWVKERGGEGNQQRSSEVGGMENVIREKEDHGTVMGS